MSRRDLVVVMGSFAPREGGGERQMRRLLSQCFRGRSSAVVTQALRGELARAFIDGIEVRRVGRAGLICRLPRVGILYFMLSSLGQLVRLRPKVVVSSQLGAATVASAIYCRATRTKLVVRLSGGGAPGFPSEAPARAASWLSRLALRLLLGGRATYFVAPARHLIADLIEAFPWTAERARVIYNGVLPVFDVDPGRSREGVVWYGRPGPVKNAELMERVAARLPDVLFHVIGPTMAGDGMPNVTVHGWCDRPQDLLMSAKVALITSTTEGMPNFGLEGLACGCFVVAVENPGTQELANFGPGSVRLAALGDTDGLVAEIRYAIHMPQSEVAAPPTLAEVGDQWTELLWGPQ